MKMSKEITYKISFIIRGFSSASTNNFSPLSWRYSCYLLQLQWASLKAQLVKNPPAMQETLVRLLGQEDPLEKGQATHSSILAWRIPWTV